MNTPQIIVEERTIEPHVEEAPSAFERMRYLCPSRYFRFFMFHERATHRTCWLPEGYDA